MVLDFDAFVTRLMHELGKEPLTGDVLAPDTRLDELGFDSFDALEALVVAEELAGVHRPTATGPSLDVDGWTSLGDVYSYLTSMTDESRTTP
jgi:acyl carrier protein